MYIASSYTPAINQQICTKRKYTYLERPVQKSSYYRLVSNEVYDQQKKARNHCLLATSTCPSYTIINKVTILSQCYSVLKFYLPAGLILEFQIQRIKVITKLCY